MRYKRIMQLATIYWAVLVLIDSSKCKTLLLKTKRKEINNINLKLIKKNTINKFGIPLFLRNHFQDIFLIFQDSICSQSFHNLQLCLILIHLTSFIIFFFSWCRTNEVSWVQNWQVYKMTPLLKVKKNKRKFWFG